MKQTHLLLTALQDAFPPDPETRHNLTLQGDRLCLTIHCAGRYHSFLLDEKDMTSPTDELVNEIAGLLKRNLDGG